ncbi:MAG: hypothetical protein PVF93_03935, partial [Chromatiaceae bacterium]
AVSGTAGGKTTQGDLLTVNASNADQGEPSQETALELKQSRRCFGSLHRLQEFQTEARSMF